MRNRLTRKYLLALAGGVVLLAAAGGVILAQTGGTEPVAGVIGEIPQAATAMDKGISVSVSGAGFSGASTVLHLDVRVSDPAALTAALPGPAGQPAEVIPSRDGFDAEGWAGYVLNVSRTRDGQLYAWLPPFVPADTYSGKVQLSFTAMDVRTDQGVTRVSGQWALPLQGPPVAKLGTYLRIEKLGPATVDAGGHQVRLEGVRSASETRVSFVLPPELHLLGTQAIEVDGKPIAPLATAWDGGKPPEGQVAAFLPTAFGSPVTFHIGPLAVAGSGDTQAVVVDIGSALARSGGQGEFAIAPGEVLSGPADLVLAGVQGKYEGDGGRQWLGVRVRGNWHASGDSPALFDQTGKRLTLAHVDVGYSKDADGNVLPGVTEVAAFTSPAELTTLTVLLGKPSAIEAAPGAVELRPAP